ncbi:efflux transporter outer membrane subunit [Microbulbifer harenosus]|uniref:Efflux transporter outer membrane subunit n=1 Tax=Microbulbifer harenosus TaxID=2576840 RepID=A0ABY2UPZ0_9GAMM|nr:efflux transporter outer membrane subunit [Microbulbifer harenosus]TLM78356.1 efflux transporter outer membrane subunit [Microbulbifer harenosus]
MDDSDYAVNKKSPLLRTIPVLLAITVGGVATVGPVFAADIDGKSVAGELPATATDWWQRFDDPLMVDLVGEALAANPDLRSAQAALRAAHAQGVIAGAALQPELSGSSSVSRSDDQSRYGAGLSASWELDLFGANRDSARAAGEDIQASSASLQDAQISLAAEVASSYIDLRRAQAQADILKRNLAAQRETAELIEARYQVGLDSELELTQTRLSLGQLLVQLPAQESAVSQSMHALAILSGAEPDALNARLQQPAGVPYVAQPLAAESDIAADLVRRRPDLRAAEHNVAAAGYRRDAAEAARYPSFRLAGGLDFSSLDAADLFDSASMARSLLGSISVPIFNSGRLKQQVTVRDAQYDQAVNSYQKTLLAALAEVADAFATLESSEQRIPQLSENLTLARNAQQLAFSRYQAGAVNFQTVLDAQRQVLSAEQNLLEVRAENSLAAIGLYRALGGSW